MHNSAALPIGEPGFDWDRFHEELRKRLPQVWGKPRGAAKPGLVGKLRGIGKVLAGFSDAVENKILDHLARGTTAPYATPSPLYMALLTTAATDASTSASLVEANYTGYARKQVPAGDWSAASAGAIATSVQEAFAACTAGTSTVIGFALSPISTTGGAGDVVMFGSVTSVTISTTQTPATIASGALSMTLD